jgi:hypothetical protein
MRNARDRRRNLWQYNRRRNLWQYNVAARQAAVAGAGVILVAPTPTWISLPTKELQQTGGNE